MSDADNEQATTDERDTNDENEGDGKKPSMGLDPHDEPDEETVEEIDKDREERLDPENRPDNAEVDNTPRDFDVERGMFKDNDDYDESEPAPFSDPEDPNNPDKKAGDEKSG